MNLDEIKKLNSAINKVLPGASIQQKKDVFGLILDAVKKECDKLSETTKFVTAKDYKLSVGLVQQLTEQAKALASQNAALKAELSVYKNRSPLYSPTTPRYGSSLEAPQGPTYNKYIEAPQGSQGSRTTVASTRLTAQEALKAIQSQSPPKEVKRPIKDGPGAYFYEDDNYVSPYRPQSISGYFPTYKTQSEKFLSEQADSIHSEYQKAKDQKIKIAAKAIEEANRAYNELPLKQSNEITALASLIHELKKDVAQAKAETLSLDDYNLS